ncbi:SGNH/GDSL hydrolase family protein [Hymenobacter elongatus]|uniref:SGNH/GDSL hydrolase family protein n=1 Tax=Hymenobacter elongatus TaxID=877208 RepID=A0A4Z0PTF8_9BACT|nr:SGNH/GDSL hydrolase family protein [Hymenobacter elongatus]TGE19682.1 SGNH/GDSL hydrolase family protein [Hymenobacter elongatus]
MNKSLLKNTLPALALLGLASCQPDLDAPAIEKGSADFSSYVAVGNSLTAGFQSGGLANSGINNSYPAILSRQFALAGGGGFVLPLFPDDRKDGSGYLKFFGLTSTGSPILLSPGQSTTVIPAGETAPRTITNNPATYQLAYTGNRLPAPPFGSGALELAPSFNPQPDNLGVPGISVLSADATAAIAVNPAFPVPVATLNGAARGYGNLNNYYQRILPAADRGTKDYVTFIGQKTPTFFTCWMGNNDVLTYATNGAVLDLANPFSGMTDTTSFGRGYRNIMRTISKNGTVAGAAANIPNVVNVPFFTSVRLADVIANFQRVNPAITTIFIREGSSTTARAATANDLFLLTAQAQFATGAGTSPTNPLPSQFVLDPAEATAIQTRTNQLNTIIARTARQNKVPLVDMNGFFNSIALRGLTINAATNNATLIRGNLFSLDGVHPTSRGYAVIANEFIRVINSNYSASIPQVNPNDYDAVLFP